MANENTLLRSCGYQFPEHVCEVRGPPETGVELSTTRPAVRAARGLATARVWSTSGAATADGETGMATWRRDASRDADGTGQNFPKMPDTR